MEMFAFFHPFSLLIASKMTVVKARSSVQNKVNRLWKDFCNQAVSSLDSVTETFAHGFASILAEYPNATTYHCIMTHVYPVFFDARDEAVPFQRACVKLLNRVLVETPVSPQDNLPSNSFIPPPPTIYGSSVTQMFEKGGFAALDELSYLTDAVSGSDEWTESQLLTVLGLSEGDYDTLLGGEDTDKGRDAIFKQLFPVFDKETTTKLRSQMSVRKRTAALRNSKTISFTPPESMKHHLTEYLNTRGAHVIYPYIIATLDFVNFRDTSIYSPSANIRRGALFFLRVALDAYKSDIGYCYGFSSIDIKKRSSILFSDIVAKMLPLAQRDLFFEVTPTTERAPVVELAADVIGDCYDFLSDEEHSVLLTRLYESGETSAGASGQFGWKVNNTILCVMNSVLQHQLTIEDLERIVDFTIKILQRATEEPQNLGAACILMLSILTLSGNDLAAQSMKNVGAAASRTLVSTANYYVEGVELGDDIFSLPAVDDLHYLFGLVHESYRNEVLTLSDIFYADVITLLVDIMCERVAEAGAAMGCTLASLAPHHFVPFFDRIHDALMQATSKVLVQSLRLVIASFATCVVPSTDTGMFTTFLNTAMYPNDIIVLKNGVSDLEIEEDDLDRFATFFDTCYCFAMYAKACGPKIFDFVLTSAFSQIVNASSLGLSFRSMLLISCLSLDCVNFDDIRKNLHEVVFHNDLNDDKLTRMAYERNPTVTNMITSNISGITRIFASHLVKQDGHQFLMSTNTSTVSVTAGGYDEKNVFTEFSRLLQDLEKQSAVMRKSTQRSTNNVTRVVRGLTLKHIDTLKFCFMHEHYGVLVFMLAFLLSDSILSDEFIHTTQIGDTYSMGFFSPLVVFKHLRQLDPFSVIQISALFNEERGIGLLIDVIAQYGMSVPIKKAIRHVLLENGGSVFDTMPLMSKLFFVPLRDMTPVALQAMSVVYAAGMPFVDLSLMKKFTKICIWLLVKGQEGAILASHTARCFSHLVKRFGGVYMNQFITVFKKIIDAPKMSTYGVYFGEDFCKTNKLPINGVFNGQLWTMLTFLENLLNTALEAVAPFTILIVGFMVRFFNVQDQMISRRSRKVFGDILGLISPSLDIFSDVVAMKFRPLWEESRTLISGIFGRHATSDVSNIPFASDMKLRSYQLTGVSWLLLLCNVSMGGILADDMGLGKTIQMLSAISLKVRDDEMIKPHLVVCPASVIGHWVDECAHFINLKGVSMYSGSNNVAIPDENTGAVYVCSYQYLTNNIKTLSKVDYGFIVLDEGHYISNVKSKRFNAVVQLVSRFRFVLTGTPVQNSVGDIWAVFEFLMPGFLGSHQEFRNLVENPVRRVNEALYSKFKVRKQAALRGKLTTEPLKKLHKQIGPLVLRRLKTTVLADLPPKNIIDRRVVFTKEEEELYLALVEESELVSDAITASKAAGLLTYRLSRKICTHPSLLQNDKSPTAADLYRSFVDGKEFSCEHGSSKFDAFVELLRECNICKDKTTKTSDLTSSGQLKPTKHRALVFAQSKDSLTLLESTLIKIGLKDAYLRLDGDVAEQNRHEMVRAFNTDPFYSLMLLTTKVGSHGLNLQSADTVIFLECDTNPAQDLQAMDRVHRLGQTNSVTVYRLIVKDTIEEKILSQQVIKQTVASSVVKEQDVSDLKTEELFDLYAGEFDSKMEME
ncbi:hypothetical protein PCE1_004705 [Barthelona sp. PCE]